MTIVTTSKATLALFPSATNLILAGAIAPVSQRSDSGPIEEAAYIKDRNSADRRLNRGRAEFVFLRERCIWNVTSFKRGKEAASLFLRGRPFTARIHLLGYEAHATFYFGTRNG